MLTANDYKNAIAMINRAQVQGTEVEEIAQLKAKLMQAHNFAAQTESGQVPDVPVDPGAAPADGSPLKSVD